jgi:transposase
MSYREFEVYEYRQIIYRLQKGESQRAVAKAGFASRDKVKSISAKARDHGWLALGAPLPCDDEIARICETNSKPSKSSVLDEYKDLIQGFIEQGIQASVIHPYLEDNYGLDVSYSCVQRYIKQLKQDETIDLTMPLSFAPGEAVQIDFGQGPRLLDLRTGKEVKTWFFVMTLCFSRHQYAELVTNQEISTWLRCHQKAFEFFDGVPKKLIIDNPKCAVIKACSEPTLQRTYEEFAQEHNCIISPCPVADPQKKGRVESGVKYVKNNFVPLREFKSLQDANIQLKDWVLSKAGNRIHGTTRKKPLNVFAQIEKDKLLPLPVNPVDICVYKKAKLNRDCHVKVDYCRYSAPSEYYNQYLWVKLSCTTVKIYHEHKLIAQHARSFDPDIPKTKQEHLSSKAQAFFEQNEQWCLEQAQQIGANCTLVVETLLTDPTTDLLRATQSVIRLSNKYTPTRLEQACQRAVGYKSISLDTVKKILKKGLDQQSAIKLEQCLGSAYTGKGIYQRYKEDYARDTRITKTA